MKNQNGYEKRCKAIQLYKEGYGFSKILQFVQSSKGWLFKSLGRFKEHGFKGLKDKSRIPKRIWRKTPEHLVKRILSIRAELEAHKSRWSTFSEIGAEVIHWELGQRGIHEVPAISTIGNILSRYGKTRKVKTRKNNNNQPYPYSKAEKMADPHQTDLVGPGHIRGPKGAPDFIPFIPWMLQDIQPSQVSFLINRPSPSVSILLKHGDIWGSVQKLRRTNKNTLFNMAGNDIRHRHTRYS